MFKIKPSLFFSLLDQATDPAISVTDYEVLEKAILSTPQGTEIKEALSQYESGLITFVELINTIALVRCIDRVPVRNVTQELNEKHGYDDARV